MSVSSGVIKKLFWIAIGVIVIALIWGAFIVWTAATADAAEPQICILKGTVLNVAGDYIPNVFIVAICDTNFIKIENHAAWLLKYNHTKTDDFGQWRLPLVAGLKYRLEFLDDWENRQSYVEEHYYIPFCDSVYFGESNCIEETP